MFDPLSINRENFITVFQFVHTVKAEVQMCNSGNGNLLHYIVLMPEIKLENLSSTIAILEYCGCDFYKEENAEGKAACYLAARRAQSYPLFSELGFLRKMIEKLVSGTCSEEEARDVLRRSEWEFSFDD